MIASLLLFNKTTEVLPCPRATLAASESESKSNTTSAMRWQPVRQLSKHKLSQTYPLHLVHSLLCISLSGYEHSKKISLSGLQREIFSSLGNSVKLDFWFQSSVCDTDRDKQQAWVKDSEYRHFFCCSSSSFFSYFWFHHTHTKLNLKQGLSFDFCNF